MMQTLVQGWTERVKTQLFADGAAFNLTGFTVAMVVYTENGSIFAPAGTSGVDTAATGIVYFDPSAADLMAVNSPYLVRWKVTDSGGKSAFFPNGAAEQWVVHV
jgi:hypothetical protein